MRIDMREDFATQQNQTMYDVTNLYRRYGDMAPHPLEMRSENKVCATDRAVFQHTSGKIYVCCSRRSCYTSHTY